jgi:hypothetical protein
MGLVRKPDRPSSGQRLRGGVLVICVSLACACGPSRPNRAVAAGYAGDDESEGGERGEQDRARETSTDIDDDEYVRGLFLELADAPRIRTCAPPRAAWVIIAYAPDVLDEHRVRTREIHCSERVLSDRCKLVSDVRYYLLDPKDYFSVADGVKPERALQLAELSASSNDGGRLLAIAADKGGVYLITRGQCGTETQVAVRLKGTAAARRIEQIETRYSIEL